MDKRDFIRFGLAGGAAGIFVPKAALGAGMDKVIGSRFAGVLYYNQGTENTGWLTDSMLAQIAASVPGLNVHTLFSQRSSSTVKKQVSEIDASAQTDTGQGTPTVLIGKNGTKPKDVAAAGGAPTLNQVESAIATAIAG